MLVPSNHVEPICPNLKPDSQHFCVKHIKVLEVNLLVNLHLHRLLAPAHSQSLSISHAHLLGGILISSAVQIHLNATVLPGFVNFNISIS